MNKLICFAVVIFFCAIFQKGVQGKAINVVSYLSRFGYLPPEYKNSGTANLISDELLRSALVEYQTFYGLNASGVADDKTLELMAKPRCGVPDKFWTNSRSENYELGQSGYVWYVSRLSYRVTKYSSRRELTYDFVDEAVDNVFRIWSKYCALTFIKNGSSLEVDMEIRFEKRAHDECESFDGPGYVLAHAFYPSEGLGGDIHFDDDENWSTNSGGVQFMSVAIHEFGHALGLNHSRVATSMMYTYYHDSTGSWDLHDDDIAGIQALYGPPNGTGPVTRAPPPPGYGICNETLKNYTLLTDSDGRTYFFKGTYYWELTESGIPDGYPKLVNETWRGLDGYIDGAVVYYGVTYFFQGSMCYAFKQKIPVTGYPMHIISKFSYFPSNIDAALLFNSKIYVFKGKQYWGYPMSFWSRLFGKTYPKALTPKWGKNVPLQADAAISYSNGRNYFFKGNQYWRYSDRYRNVDSDSLPFPRNITDWWLLCRNDHRRPYGTL